MTDKWKQIVGSVAPALATALGGPLAGLAVKTIAGKVLGDENAPQSEVEKAIIGASPEILLKLKQADQEFAVQMRELDIDVLELANVDRDSARNREVKTGDVWTPRILAGLVVLVWGMVQFHVLTGVIDETMKAIALRAMGILDAAVITVLAYYFGSSAGSKSKTDALARK